MRIADLSAPGAPRYFIRGTQWERICQVFSILVYLFAPTTPVKRGAYSSYMDAHTFLVTTESNLGYAWIPKS
eukprot:8452262-Pyramimonas_sp.AAC.1